MRRIDPASLGMHIPIDHLPDNLAETIAKARAGGHIGTEIPDIGDINGGNGMQSTANVYPSLDRETRSAVNTDTAAYHLSRSPQTLRLWACKGAGPVTPIRIHGRLAWPTAELRRVLGV